MVKLHSAVILKKKKNENKKKKSLFLALNKNVKCFINIPRRRGGLQKSQHTTQFTG